MAKFKAIILFANCHIKETIEIEADTLGAARIKCEEIKKANNDLVSNLIKKNIYTNRLIKKCELSNVDWRDEFLGCLKISETKQSESILPSDKI